VLAVLAAAGVLTMPLTLPVLPVPSYLAYAAALHLQPESVREKNRMGPLPQFYADMFGWPEMVAVVAGAYHRLSPSEQAKCALFAPYNYGEAGAIDLFGPRHGLPRAISGHNEYYVWGPGDYTGEIMLVLGMPREELERLFQSVEQVAVIEHPYAMPYENGPVYLCRGLKKPLRDLWPRFKHYW
jgi:hypothetical protein